VQMALVLDSPDLVARSKTLYARYCNTGDGFIIASDGPITFQTGSGGSPEALQIDTSQNATFAGDITASGDLLPATTHMYDIGSGALQWNDLYSKGAGKFGDFYVNTTSKGSDGISFNGTGNVDYHSRGATRYFADTNNNEGVGNRFAWYINQSPTGASGPVLTIDDVGDSTFAGDVELTTGDVILNGGSLSVSKSIYQTAEVTSLPTGTTQTITLTDNNHQTLDLTSSTGDATVTLTVPSGSSAGTLIIEQHATTARDLTWAVSAGALKWMGTEPTWSSDAVSAIRIVTWRYDGAIMYLAATDVAA